MATTRSKSSGVIAFTGSMTLNTRDIPKLHGRDSLTAVAARSVPVSTLRGHLPLPTPPNSMSPSLSPSALKVRAASSSRIPVILDPIESDFDLHDTPMEDQGSPKGFESTGAITPALLAKHHLPEILLMHGPLAIRHVMGYLTTSVPGFSGIPPAKARRLVVGALEGRGGSGEGGGLDGDVKFEKVGWGRWDARMKGQLPRASGDKGSPPMDPTKGMPIKNAIGRAWLNAPSSSWAGDSAAYSHDDDMDVMMLENEADKMSLDGDESLSSSSYGPPEGEMIGDDPNDMTDDEDWAAVGAAALRQASFSASGPQDGHHALSHVYTSRGSYGPSKSMATSVRVASNNTNFSVNAGNSGSLNFSAMGMDMASNAQEREAIEALLRLGSV